MKAMIPIPQVFNAILSTFLTILMIRVTSPIIDPIMALWDSGMMKTAATLAMWVIYFFVLYFLTWQTLLKHTVEEKTGGQ